MEVTHTHGFSEVDHKEVDAAEVRWEIGYAQDGSIAVSGGNKVGNELHMDTTGDGVTVSVAVANF